MTGIRDLSWRSRPVRVSIAIGLAVVGVVLLWVALSRSTSPDSAIAPTSNDTTSSSTAAGTAEPTPEPSTARGQQTDVRDKITGLVLPESHPVTLSIPRLGISSKLVDLGLGKKGQMETPPPPVAGWFTQGPTPGALGPAVIAGHVTWNGSRAVFYRLGTMQPGDRVIVTRKDRRTAIFTVERVARFPKSQFPSRDVYGAIDHAGLRLITCGGTYDAAGHRYLDNVVVFAKLEAVRGPGS